MKRIKSFKLFESISGEAQIEERIAEIAGIYEDAKSIEYILEEGDYDYEWKISTEHNSYKIGYDISDLIRSYSYTGDGSVFHHDFLKSVTICINVLGVDGKVFSEVSSKTVDEVKSDMLRFKTLLEDHLDYLPAGSITLFDAGWIGNYKINIKIG
jgi:hypothetical protein